MDHFVAERLHFFPGRPSPVHEYQRLAIPDRGVPQNTASESGCVDEPPGRKLRPPSPQRVGDELRIILKQRPRLQFRHNRVLEERAGVSEFLRIGELCSAKRFDRGEH